MKIIFLCSSLESGYDGVGDYTQRLSEELVRLGHQVSIIAFQDQHIRIKQTSIHQTIGSSISILRLPALWPISDRCYHAESWINYFDPEWISLQFVPFGFHRKGLPFRLSHFLKPLGYERNWQIMFHELWVGMDEQSSVKYIIWGWIQRILIQSLIKNLCPKLIHTQTYLYQLQLAKIGIKAEYLALFGNIPKISNTKFNNNLVLSEFKTDLSFVLFGGIHPRAPIDQFAKEVYTFCSKNKVNAKLKFLGRNGTEKQHWLFTWESVGLGAEVFDEQDPDTISRILSSSSIGITTTPLYLAEKSGSVAAMIEHNLPIFCISRPWNPRGFEDIRPPSRIYEYKPGNFDTIIFQSLTTPKLNDVTLIAHQFLESLSMYI